MTLVSFLSPRGYPNPDSQLPAFVRADSFDVRGNEGH